MFFRPETIPIIIIPGIAGSALEPRIPEDVRRNGPGWPLNDLGGMLKILLRGPRGKRKNMIGPDRHSANYLQVIGGNNPHVRGNESGLLGVAKLKYEGFVNKINDKNAEHKNPEKSAGKPLSYHYFRIPPHCFGYNWTADITLSGPEAYFRMKTGFPRNAPGDGIVAAVTMRNGDEAAAVLGNIPGGLQLLPSKAYRTNAGDVSWLELDCGSAGRYRYPKVDPYIEIYANPNHMWGLVDKELLNPRWGADPDEEFEHYKEKITHVVMPLHDAIEGVEFPFAIQVVSKRDDSKEDEEEKKRLNSLPQPIRSGLRPQPMKPSSKASLVSASHRHRAKTGVSTRWPESFTPMTLGGGTSSLTLALAMVMQRCPSPLRMALTQEDRTQLCPLVTFNTPTCCWTSGLPGVSSNPSTRV